ncbi:MAG: twin-arginine translocase TatA/TatE family subunit [Myxococcales bacterium]|nr:twin-arginine translocase TatA/TatE family subunit [Myxococcales bacterium]
MWELVLILIVVVLIFGATRIPQLGDSFGKIVGKLRAANRDDEEKKGKKDDEGRP